MCIDRKRVREGGKETNKHRQAYRHTHVCVDIYIPSGKLRYIQAVIYLGKYTGRQASRQENRHAGTYA